MEIECKASNNNSMDDSALYLRKTSGQVGANKASGTDWSTTDATRTYGGAADTWSAGLVQSDIVSTDFGMDLSANGTGIPTTASVDNVRIRINYTLSGLPAGVKSMDMHTQAQAALQGY